MLMFRYGAGYNFFHLAADNNNILPLPDFVNYIELGLAEYKVWVSQPDKLLVNLSLHLARTPVTEGNNTQDQFIEYLYQETNKAKSNVISSIGIHLTGPRHEGIGKFGFSSHFIPSAKAKIAAIRFIKQLKQKFQIPILIENANFYSNTIHEILNTWHAIAYICDQSGAELILDLSHLIIDAKNNHADPVILLGAIPWRHVAEFHLSGIIVAQNGSWHDGHSEPIHAEVWDLLINCLSNLIQKDKEIIFTIEHTDPKWIKKPENYRADFLKLKSLIENFSQPVELTNHSANSYARNYLKKLLKQWLPATVKSFEEKNLSFDLAFEQWLAKISQDGKRIILSAEEIPPIEQQQVCIAATDFVDFANRVFSLC